MKIYALSLLVLLIILSSPGCNPHDPNDLSPFYFPYEKYTEGAVLEFRPARLPDLGNEYWYLKSFSDSGKKYLVTQLFNDKLRLQQYKLEEYIGDGVLSRDVKLFRHTPDSSVLLQLDVRQNDVFPFIFKDSFTRYIYDLSWSDPVDSMDYRLIRNRRFTHQEDRMFLGKVRTAWHSEILEELETIKDGSTISQWSGEEWFARDIGLVYFKKQITPEFSREYYLHTIHDWGVFEKTIGPNIIE